MKRNGMCPICYLKQLFGVRSSVSDILSSADAYPAENAPVPPMGWSSWNTFKNNITADLIYDTAAAMKDKGLLDAGYNYVNIDDCWHSSIRTADGKLQGDLERFAEGVAPLVKKINDLGIKVGIYSSNGTLTCEDLPASLGKEVIDAETFAEWGIEYFKYDFCHNVQISKYAPLVFGLYIAKKGQSQSEFYAAESARLTGEARFMSANGKKFLSGLDRNAGAAEFTVNAPESGEYVLTVSVKKKGRYKKYLLVKVGDRAYEMDIPDQKHFNETARFQAVIKLNEGENNVKIFNPIAKRADSAMTEYRRMGAALIAAAEKVAQKEGRAVKPITFSLCEWGLNKPHKWGATAGNLWRTTPDIRPVWTWIKYIYGHNVKLYKYASVGHWNDPDMLEVGNGKLSYDENLSHFALWCMMASPLILGNDLRAISPAVLQIVTNKNLIAINQDKLGKQAKRIVKGSVDVLVKPLSDGKTAVCFFNKSRSKKTYSLPFEKLLGDSYLEFVKRDSYNVFDAVEEKRLTANGELAATINGHGVKVFVI